MHMQLAIINTDWQWSNKFLDDMTDKNCLNPKKTAKNWSLCLFSYQLSIPKKQLETASSYITLLKRVKI